MAMETEERAGDDAWWAALVIALLHPVQVQIIEALRWIDRPLSVRDLAEVVDTEQAPHLLHHLRRLIYINAVQVERTATLTEALQVPYRLATTPGRR
jgi:DNA-binding transcriptional ArsR family regulator